MLPSHHHDLQLSQARLTLLEVVVDAAEDATEPDKASQAVTFAVACLDRMLLLASGIEAEAERAHVINEGLTLFCF